MFRYVARNAAIAALCASVCAPAFGQVLATRRVVNGLTRPVFVTAPPGDDTRLFVVESRFRATTADPWSGRIEIVNIPANTINPTPFFTVSSVATTTAGAYIAEQGLLGLAFHPNYLSNGYFYVHYTRASDFAVIIARARANPPYATSTSFDAASLTTLLTIPHPTNTNHNGGWLAFGPDGYLYDGIGDGGNGGDPPNNAQNLGTLLGKIIRVDVDGPDNIPGNADDADTTAGTPYRIPPGNPFSGAGQRKEIWAYGLRNPWRCSFDRQTGDLWIGDVGQDRFEEIDFQPAGLGGRNYGWRCMEGFECSTFGGCTCNDPGQTLPIANYSHTIALPPFGLVGCAIIGGYRYRGCAMPMLRGTYFFSDNCTPSTISFRFNGTIFNALDRSAELEPPGTDTIANISSFGEDATGELYILSQNSTSNAFLYKIVPAQTTTPCSACPADLDNGSGVGIPDGGVTIDDLLYFLTIFSDGSILADLDDGTGTGTPDAGVTIDDLLYFVAHFDLGC